MGVSDSTSSGGKTPQSDGQSTGSNQTQIGNKTEVFESIEQQVQSQTISDENTLTQTTGDEEIEQQNLQQMDEISSSEDSEPTQSLGKGHANTPGAALTKLDARSPTLVANNVARQGQDPNNYNVEEMGTGQAKQLPQGVEDDSVNLPGASNNLKSSDDDPSNMNNKGDSGEGSEGSGGANRYDPNNKGSVALMKEGFDSYSAMRYQDVVATELGKNFGFTVKSMTEDAEKKQMKAAQNNYVATETEAMGSIVGSGISFGASGVGLGLNVGMQSGTVMGLLGKQAGSGLSSMTVQFIGAVGQSSDKFATGISSMNAANTKLDAQNLDIQAKTEQSYMQAIQQVQKSLESEPSSDAQKMSQLWDSVLQAISAQRAPPR